jgi:bacterioferritin
VRAKEGVLERLGALVTLDLTATHQDLGQADACQNWGYERLYHELHDQQVHNGSPHRSLETTNG